MIWHMRRPGSRYAPMLMQLGVHVVSTDELTGVQALEWAAPTHPMEPGQPERWETEGACLY